MIENEIFLWSKVRCTQLRAELDAYYARLYCLTHDKQVNFTKLNGQQGASN